MSALTVATGSLLLLLLKGSGDSALIGWAGIGLSARLDAVSVTMLLLVSFVGWIVLRYSRTYLDGEARQGAFTGWLCAALAAVLLLVQAGNLVQLLGAWIATSFALHRLLLFYPKRIGAQRAARKKQLFAVLGALSLAGSVLLMSTAFGTTDIAAINAMARSADLSWHAPAAAVASCRARACEAYSVSSSASSVAMRLVCVATADMRAPRSSHRAAVAAE